MSPLHRFRFESVLNSMSGVIDRGAERGRLYQKFEPKLNLIIRNG